MSVTTPLSRDTESPVSRFYDLAKGIGRFTGILTVRDMV